MSVLQDTANPPPTHTLDAHRCVSRSPAWKHRGPLTSRRTNPRPRPHAPIRRRAAWLGDQEERAHAADVGAGHIQAAGPRLAAPGLQGAPFGPPGSDVSSPVGPHFQTHQPPHLTFKVRPLARLEMRRACGGPLKSRHPNPLLLQLSFDGNRKDKKKIEAEGNGERGGEGGGMSPAPRGASSSFSSSSAAASPASALGHTLSPLRSAVFSPDPPTDRRDREPTESDNGDDDDDAAVADQSPKTFPSGQSGHLKKPKPSACDLSRLRTDQIVVQFETESQVRHRTVRGPR